MPAVMPSGLALTSFLVTRLRRRGLRLRLTHGVYSFVLVMMQEKATGRFAPPEGTGRRRSQIGVGQIDSARSTPSSVAASDGTTWHSSEIPRCSAGGRGRAGSRPSRSPA